MENEKKIIFCQGPPPKKKHVLNSFNPINNLIQMNMLNFNGQALHCIMWKQVFIEYLSEIFTEKENQS